MAFFSAAFSTSTTFAFDETPSRSTSSANSLN
jgi:hypothetical protein